MSFDLQLIIESLPVMLMGIGITFKLLVISGVLGLLLAICLLLMRISGLWYLNIPAQIYIYVFRGTPILVQIFIVYYGLPQFESVRESIFWPILREPTGCAILALSLNTGAYVSEILRGGVLEPTWAAFWLCLSGKWVYLPLKQTRMLYSYAYAARVMRHDTSR